MHLQHETFLYGGPSSVPALGPALRSLRRARQGVVVTMHHVVDPGSVDARFTAVHRVRAPWRVARAGLGRVQRTITRGADAVLVHEPGFADVVPDAHVVPHGIDVDPAAGEAAAARARLGLDERFTALCFGFLAPYKGLETALRAANVAGDRVHLVIAGGEHPRMAGDGYADGLRALGPATFAGPVPDADVRDWFAAAEVALFPYPRPHATSGPLALALGAGTPVLLSEALAACAGAPVTLAVPADPVALGGRLATPAADEAARDALAAGVGGAGARSLVAARRAAPPGGLRGGHAMSTVLLAGAFGQRNPGDEALLRAFVQALPGRAIVATSVDPVATEATHGVHAVGSRDGRAVRTRPARQRRRRLRGRHRVQGPAPDQRAPPAGAAALGPGCRDRHHARCASRWRSSASAPARCRGAALARSRAPSSAAPTCSCCATRNRPVCSPTPARHRPSGSAPTPPGRRLTRPRSRAPRATPSSSPSAAWPAAPGSPAAWPSSSRPPPAPGCACACSPGSCPGTATSPTTSPRRSTPTWRSCRRPPTSPTRATSSPAPAWSSALRFHALVAAAAAGTPAVALAHEPKLSGLGRRLGYPVIEPTGPPQALGRAHPRRRRPAAGLGRGDRRRAGPRGAGHGPPARRAQRRALGRVGRRRRPRPRSGGVDRMSATTTVDLRGRPAPPRPALRTLAGEQLLVAGGQLAAGIGNLAFSLVAAAPARPRGVRRPLRLPGAVPARPRAGRQPERRQRPVPGAGRRAARPRPAHRRRRRRRSRPRLAADRGRAAPPGDDGARPGRRRADGRPARARAGPGSTGSGRSRRAAGSLLAEPAVRLAAGVALGAALGPAGAAAGAHARRLGRAAPSPHTPGAGGAPAAAASAPVGTVLAFLGLAIVQNQDVLVANALLPAGEAGRFAVLSTLGGVAAFATTTVPLMLLPRARSGDRRALPAALAVAAALGVAAVAVVAVDPRQLVTGVFGAQYAPAAALAVPYLIAMALLGVSRVVVAHACATGAARPALAVLGGAIALHLGLLLAMGDDAAGVAHATLIASTALAVGTGGAARDPPAHGARARPARAGPPARRTPHGSSPASSPSPSVCASATTHGLWVDEAIQRPPGAAAVRRDARRHGDDDVHPPLHHTLLWITVRVFRHVRSSPCGCRRCWRRRARWCPRCGVGHATLRPPHRLDAAVLATIAPFCVWYSQEARMYAQFMLFAAVAIGAPGPGDPAWPRRDWVLYALATAVLCGRSTSPAPVPSSRSAFA